MIIITILFIGCEVYNPTNENCSLEANEDLVTEEFYHKIQLNKGDITNGIVTNKIYVLMKDLIFCYFNSIIIF